MKTFPHRIAALVFGLMLSVAARVSAHAFLDHSEPRVGSEVSSSPTEVKLWFTQAIEPAFSRIQIFDSSGQEIDKKDSHVDANDNKAMIISLPQLPAGTFKVVWHVVSVDTHKTQGDFKFVVK